MCLHLTAITDSEPAFKNAIVAVFPNITHLLCCWHHKQNVCTDCRKRFVTDELWKEFELAWLNCIDAPTKTEYNTRWVAMQAKYRESELRELIAYLQKNWQGTPLSKIA